MNSDQLIADIRNAPNVHRLLLAVRDRPDLSKREYELAVASIVMTLIATRQDPNALDRASLSLAGEVTLLALNAGGKLHDLAPASTGNVRLYTAQECWGSKSAWGFVTDSAAEKHRRSGTLGASNHDTLALTALLEGLMSVPHGSTVQAFSRNMNADGYMTGRYRAKTPELQSLIDDVRTVAAQAGLNVRYDFLSDRASKSHIGLLEAESLALSTIRGPA